MAGGEGTRLRPLTSNMPKPMLPLVNRPMMEHIVELLRGHDITEIVVTLAFMPNVIRNYFGDGSEFGVQMVYATEESPLGTAGSVRNAMAELDDTFLVISGDVLTDVDLGAIIDDVVVASMPEGSVVDETIDVLDSDGTVLLEDETVSVYVVLELVTPPVPTTVMV